MYVMAINPIVRDISLKIKKKNPYWHKRKVRGSPKVLVNPQGI